MKIVSIVGARPQFIKCAALTQELRMFHQDVIVHTGQHYDYEMSDIFFKELEIPKPDYYLGIGSGTHGYQTGQMLIAIEEVLYKEKPDMVLVYGDTNSTLAGALAARKSQFPVGHVEAGLRQLDQDMPEEINRILVDHCSKLLFCPTKKSVSNLSMEGINRGVFLTGDVMIDILLKQREIAERSKILDDLCIKSKHYFIVTVHRAGNTDNMDTLQNIVEALLKIDYPIIFPIHPRTGNALKKFGLDNKLSLNNNIRLVKPMPYLDFLKLMSHAKKIITDSGGIEKEAYILKVPCITMLDSTGWEETVEDGWNVLVGTNTQQIVRMANNFNPINEQSENFGMGHASKNICQAIEYSFTSNLSL